MKNNKLGVLAKDTGLFAINSFGSKILMFLLTPVYTALLTTEEYGIADLITATINFTYPLLTLAIADATLRFALDAGSDKSKVLCNSLLVTVISIIVLSALFPLVVLANIPLREWWVIFVIIYALFNIHNCVSSFIKGIGATRLFAIQGIVQTIIIIISNIVLLVFFRKGIEGYLISIMLGYGIPIILMLFWNQAGKYIIKCNIDVKLIKEMLVYSIPMIPALLAWAINTNIDKYMIIEFINIGASGIYSIAHKIPAIFESIIAIFIQAWQLSSIRNYGCEDEKVYYTSVYNILSVFCLLICLLIMLVNKRISSFLFAKDFYEAWKCVPLLTVSAMFSSMAGFLNSAFRASKQTKCIFKSALWGVMINLILNWFLIKHIGIIGAAFATSISFFVIWLCRMIMVQNIISIVINKPVTVFSYVLFILSALFSTIDNKYKSELIIISIILIFIINFKDLKNSLLDLKK